MKLIHSYDVFDTCLTRSIVTPSGVFYEAGREAFARMGTEPTRERIEDFIAARTEAEFKARFESKVEDITLAEIWKILAASMGWKYEPSLVECELRAENQALLPIVATLSKINSARTNGHRIVFVSDMYLPTDFVESQLRKHGFFKDGDGLYLSSSIGKTKASGNLFKHLIATEKTEAANILHTGDNHHSDIASAKNLGIQTRLCDAAFLTATEAAVLKSDGDLEKNSRIAAGMRAFRVSAKAEEDNSIFELTAQLAGPFVFGLAVWILEQARQNGVKRLYFLSRDCQLLCKVANVLAPRFGGIECKYLYVSRQALFLPSSESISPEGMPWMRRIFEKPVLRKMLAKLDLKFESVQASLEGMAGKKGGDYQLASEADWTKFWQALNQEPIKTQLENLIISRRNLSRKYFEAAGLFDDTPWAIVDLGWTLGCQRALWTLMKQWGWQKTIRGYYFGLFQQRFGPVTAGNSDALFYRPPADIPRDARVNAVFDRVTLLEHIIGCADHPTVHHHERQANGEMGAVYASSVSQTTLNFCRELHASTLDFARQNLALIDDLKDTAICQSFLATVVTNFFSFPAAKPASALLGLSASEDQNGLNPLPIVKPLEWSSTLVPFSPKADPFQQNKSVFWLEGSLAITPGSIRKLLKFNQRAANRLNRARR